ncbi:MAG TPA: ATP-binding protein [Pseudomonadota bacterium]|nr:ATP-binding protein [Pseudomonadota bacterium]
MDSSEIPTPAESAEEMSDELAAQDAAEPSAASLPPDETEDEASDALSPPASATSSPPEEEGEEAEEEDEPEGEAGGPTLALPPEPSATMRSRQLVEVPAAELTGRVDPSLLPESPQRDGSLFSLLEPVTRRALDMGIVAPDPGFHMFVAVDREVMIDSELVARAQELVRSLKTPGDLVYVHNFDDPDSPLCLQLPAGAGPALQEAMGDLLAGLHDRMPQLSEADDVQRSQARINVELENKTREIVQGLEASARHHGFGVRNVQGVFQTFPILHGKPLSAEQFDVLDEGTKRVLQGSADRVTREVERAARRMRAQNAQLNAEQDAAVSRAAGQLVQREMRDLFERFSGMSSEVARYLRQVRQALSESWRELMDADEDGHSHDEDDSGLTALDRFRVNVLVTHRAHSAAPVVFESNPTTSRLFGYIGRRAQYGALLSDFLHIKPGALHRAVGGVLILRVADVLAEPGLWERLKRALREGRLAVDEGTGSAATFATTLRPQPVALSTRVVLIGTPELYDSLRMQDGDFRTIFRGKVEVDPIIERSEQNLLGLDAHLMSLARERSWGTFERGARARLLELSTQLAEDRERLALAISQLEEICVTASMTARAERRPVTMQDVEDACREHRERLSMDERRIREACLRGEVAVETTGMRVGVVNGLSVMHTGDIEFGQPMRISAVVALGREGIVDVEREAQLSGAIHTKGVAIVRGYLGWMFGQERPLSLRAQLVFEQSYGEIDGDSASSSELFAVLSALADIGIDQGIAVTGSVNQLGQVQAIGGVCAKIEGFYDLCLARGLTGTQGVMIPRVNLPHLVLRPDVVQACADGRFHVYAIDNVTQGIEVLCGLPAGDRDSSGRFPAASIFGRVERRIIEIAERLRHAESHGFSEGEPIDEGGAELSERSDFRRLQPPARRRPR